MARLKLSRRTMLQGMVAAAALLTWHKPTPAVAQSRAESLVAIGESGLGIQFENVELTMGWEPIVLAMPWPGTVTTAC